MDAFLCPYVTSEPHPLTSLFFFLSCLIILHQLHIQNSFCLIYFSFPLITTRSVQLLRIHHDKHDFCVRDKRTWIGVTASAPPPLSHVLRMDPMASIDVDFCLTQTMKMSQISNTCETHNHVKRPHLWSFSQGISQFLKHPHVSFYPLYTWHPQKHEIAIVFSFFLLSWIDFCTHSKPCKDGYSDHRTAQWLQGYACHN